MVCSGIRIGMCSQAHAYIPTALKIQDKVDHLLTQGDFLLAIDLVKEAKLEKMAEIGDKFLTHLMEQNDYQQATSVLPRLLSQEDTSGWMRWTAVFAERRQLAYLAPLLPLDLPGTSLKRRVFLQTPN